MVAPGARAELSRGSALALAHAIGRAGGGPAPLMSAPLAQGLRGRYIARMLTLLTLLVAPIASASDAPAPDTQPDAVADDGNGPIAETPAATRPPPGQGGRRPPPGDRPPEGGRRPPKGDARPEELFRLGGDFQVNFVAEHLERGGDPAYADNPSRPTFTIAHLRPRVDFDATPWLALRASMEFAAVPESPPVDPEVLGDTLVVSSDEAILSPAVDELYLRLHTGKALRQALRMGVLHTAFGLRDDYDDYDKFFLGGQLAYMEPERRFGISPGTDIGLGWRLAYKDLAALDLQLINGSGATKLDGTATKDMVARLTLSPIDVVEVRGSVMHAGNSTDGHTHGAFSLGLNGGRFLPSVSPRIVTEGIMSRVTAGGVDDDRIAWLVAAAGDIPIRTTATDHVSLVASYSGFDPKFISGGPSDSTSFDQNWYIDVGANLYWNTEGRRITPAREGKRDRTPTTTAFTGLTFEQVIPQNADLAVSNSIVIHCGLSR